MTTDTQTISSFNETALVATRAARGNPLDQDLGSVMLDKKAANAVLILPAADIAALTALGLPRTFAGPDGEDVALYGKLANDSGQVFLDLTHLAAHIVRTIPTEAEQTEQYEKVIAALSGVPAAARDFLNTFVSDHFSQVLSPYARAFANTLYPVDSPDKRQGFSLTDLRPRLQIHFDGDNAVIHVAYDAAWTPPSGLGNRGGKDNQPLVFPRMLTLQMILPDAARSVSVEARAVSDIPEVYRDALTPGQLQAANDAGKEALALLSPNVVPTDVTLTLQENALLAASLGLIQSIDLSMKGYTDIVSLKTDADRDDYRLAFSKELADEVERILSDNGIPETGLSQDGTNLLIWQRDTDGGLTIFYDKLRKYQMAERPEDESLGNPKPYRLLNQIGTLIGKPDFLDICALAFDQVFKQLLAQAAFTGDSRLLMVAAQDGALQLNISRTATTITYPTLNFVSRPEALKFGQVGRVPQQAPFARVVITPAAQINEAADLNRFQGVSIQVNEGPDLKADKERILFEPLKMAISNTYQLQLAEQGFKGDSKVDSIEKKEIETTANVADLAKHLIALFTRKSDSYLAANVSDSIPTLLGELLALSRTLEMMLALLKLDPITHATSIHDIQSLLNAATHPVSQFFSLSNNFLERLQAEVDGRDETISDLIVRARLGSTSDLITLLDRVWSKRDDILDTGLFDDCKKVLAAIPDSLILIEPKARVLKVLAVAQQDLLDDIKTFFDALPSDAPLLVARDVMQRDGSGLLSGFLYVAQRVLAKNNYGSNATDAFIQLSNRFPNFVKGAADELVILNHFREGVRELGREVEKLATERLPTAPIVTPGTIPAAPPLAANAPEAVLLERIDIIGSELAAKIVEEKATTQAGPSKKDKQTAAARALTAAYNTIDADTAQRVRAAGDRADEAQRNFDAAGPTPSAAVETELQDAQTEYRELSKELRFTHKLHILTLDRRLLLDNVGALKHFSSSTSAAADAARWSAILKMNETYGGIPCLVTLNNGVPVSAEFIGIGDSTVYPLAAPQPTPRRSFFNLWSSNKKAKTPEGVAAQVKNTLLEQVAPKPTSIGPRSRASSALIFLFTSEQFILVEELLSLFL